MVIKIKEDTVPMVTERRKEEEGIWLRIVI